MYRTLQLALLAAILFAPLSISAEEPERDALRDSILERMQRFQKQVHECHEVAEHSTTVKVQFVILKSGHIEVRKVWSEDDEPKAIECVREKYQGLTFTGLELSQGVPVTFPHPLRKPTPLKGIDLD